MHYLKVSILNIICCFITILSFGQSKENSKGSWTFRHEGRANGPFYRYIVSEITLHADSTYERIDYIATTSFDREKYKDWDKEIINGKWKASNQHYLMIGEEKDNEPYKDGPYYFKLKQNTLTITHFTDPLRNKIRIKGIRFKK